MHGGNGGTSELTNRISESISDLRSRLGSNQSGGGCGCSGNKPTPKLFEQPKIPQFGGYHRASYLKSLRRRR